MTTNVRIHILFTKRNDNGNNDGNHDCLKVLECNYRHIFTNVCSKCEGWTKENDYTVNQHWTKCG